MIRGQRSHIAPRNNIRLILFVIIVYLLVSYLPALAVPAAPVFSEITQPDGPRIKVRTKGDEWRNWHETVNGYTVIRDKATGWWHYAVPDEIDGIKAGRYKVGEASPEDLGIKKGLLPVRKRFRKSAAIASASVQGSSRVREASALPFNQNVLVILAEFNNYPHVPEDTVAAFHDLFFGSSISVADYYDEVSYGKFNIVPAETGVTSTPGVVGWLSVGTKHTNCHDDNICADDLASKAISAAQEYVNFANFDRNSDGVVTPGELSIIVVVAGYESAFSNYSPGVWAHQSEFQPPLKLNGVKVSSYAMFGERQGDHRATIGVIVHELGHLMLDLPDLYDTADYPSSQGIGPFDVMADGSWCQTAADKYSGQTPVHFSAWTKKYAGFLFPSEVTNQAGVELPAVSGAATAIVKVPTQNNREFFLLENRHLSGYDAGLQGCSLNFSKSDGGLAIWHVDESKLGCIVPNNCNNDASGKLVDLEEANGYQALDYINGLNNLQALFYSGNKTAFNDSTAPSSRLYQNIQSGVSVTNISGYGQIMTADIFGGTIAALTTMFVQISGNGSGTITASGLVCSGKTCTGTYPAETQLILTANADPDSTFAGWSDSGCAGNWVCSITINSDITLTATFSRPDLTYKHKIKPLARSFASSDNTGNISVITKPASSWTASSNTAWITVTSGSSGTGNGKVYYSVSANTSPDPRTGSITIAEKTFTVIQRQATDLSGVWSKVSKKKRKAKFKVSGRLTVTAIDNKAPNVKVRVYLSDDEAYDQMDILLGSKTMGTINTGQSIFKTLSYGNLPADPTGKYLIAVIDPDNKITESDKSNNTAPSSAVP